LITATAARRQKSAAINRRLSELERLTGLDPAVIDEAKDAADRRMAIIDRQRQEWRDLLNRYPHQTVARYAEIYPMAEVRRILAREFPGA
jgi:hypothetical protein